MPCGDGEVDERAEVVGLVGVGDEQRGGGERRVGPQRRAGHRRGDGRGEDDVGLGDARGGQVGGQAGDAAPCRAARSAGVSMTTSALPARVPICARAEAPSSTGRTAIWCGSSSAARAGADVARAQRRGRRRGGSEPAA